MKGDPINASDPTGMGCTEGDICDSVSARAIFSTPEGRTTYAVTGGSGVVAATGILGFEAVGGATGIYLIASNPGTGLTLGGIVSAIKGVFDGSHSAEVPNPNTLSVKEAATDLSQVIGKNRVSAMSPGGRTSIDLAGKAHFEKATGEVIETPHVKFQPLNTSPTGKTSLGPGETRAATMQDVRTARKLIEKRDE